MLAGACPSVVFPVCTEMRLMSPRRFSIDFQGRRTGQDRPLIPGEKEREREREREGEREAERGREREAGDGGGGGGGVTRRRGKRNRERGGVVLIVTSGTHGEIDSLGTMDPVKNSLNERKQSKVVGLEGKSTAHIGFWVKTSFVRPIGNGRIIFCQRD